MLTKLITFLLFIGLLTGVIINFEQSQYPVLPDDLVFKRIDGVEQPFKALKGKPVLVTFWSPTCILCMQEVGELNQLYKRHKGGDQFEILALSMYYDRPDWVIQSRSQSKMLYPVYFDLQKNLSRAFGNIVATPTSFLLNSAGEIIYHHAGRMDFSLLDQKLTELTG